MRDIATLDADIAAAEANVPALRPGCEKQIVWADQAAVKTSVALVYIHGFSATGAELRPLPDVIAASLGANVFYARLTGHGQDGAAMGQATIEDWQKDVTEAIEIGQTIGDQIILMGGATGCTLATLALAQGAQAKAMVHVSPNFGLRHRMAQLLMDMPGVRRWGHLVAGKTRSFAPISEAHTAFWTPKYPIEAVYPMADAVRAVRHADLQSITTPAMFAYNEADQDVHPTDIKKVISRWGAPVYVKLLEQGPDDDEMGHVMAGDVFSPKQTAPLAASVTAWLETL